MAAQQKVCTNGETKRLCIPEACDHYHYVSYDDDDGDDDDGDDVDDDGDDDDTDEEEDAL